MKIPKGSVCHKCAPEDWRHTPNITGNYELDASLMKVKAKRLKVDLAHHVKGASILEPNETIYGYRTGYRGYEGYSGDD